ncbi:MAG: CopG family ribbon-helix-helix protein [Terriglobales bacterium]
MKKLDKMISFRADTNNIAALDILATAKDRPRSYLLNEALVNYIELHAYQDALVRNGLRQMQKGRLLTHEEVLKRRKSRRRKQA